MGGGVGLLLIRSWVLGNEAHENRNGVLLLCLCVAKFTTPIMKGVIYMEQFKKHKLNKKDYLADEVLVTILRVLLTPIFIWYRLYLWVWDGTMFNKN